MAQGPKQSLAFAYGIVPASANRLISLNRRKPSAGWPLAGTSLNLSRARRDRFFPFPSVERQRRAPACAGDARRASLSRGLRSFPLRQSGCAEGRTADAGPIGHLRQPQSADRARHRRAAGAKLRGRKPARARAGRALHALRPARREGRDRRCAQRRHLLSQSARALFGWKAGRRRRRAVFLAAVARQGTPEPPLLLRQGGARRKSGRARGAIRIRRRRRPRIAFDPRPDADPARACDRCGVFRGHGTEAAARQRALSHRRDETGRERDVQAQPRLLGARTRGHPRALSLRRAQARLLPRRQHLVRGLQAPALRRALRNRSRPLDDAIRLSRRAHARARARKRGERRAAADARLRFQYPARDLFRSARAGGDRGIVRLRMGERQALLRRLPADGELLRGLRALRPRPACGSARAGAASPLPRCGRARRIRGPLSAAGLRRIGPRPGAAQARAGSVGRGGLAAARRRARLARGQRAAALRNHGFEPRRRAARARLRHDAAARRRHRRRALCRRHAIRAAAPDLRLRHDALYLAAVALARQRAEFLFRLGERRIAGYAQLYGREIEGDRHDDRGDRRRARARGSRGRRARPRPAVDVGRLPLAALSPAGNMDRALAVDRAAGHAAADRADDRKLVESARIVANETHGQALMRERMPDFAKGGLDTKVALDAVFRRNVLTRPGTLALADPSDRATFTDGLPRRLNYAEADVAVNRLAAQLKALGLPEGSAVALQLPNTVEGAPSLLALQRSAARIRNGSPPASP